MSTMINDPKYTEFLAWLREHVDDEARERLEYSDAALAAWLNKIDEDGHIEIPAFYSASGRPVIGSFPELAMP